MECYGPISYYHLLLWLANRNARMWTKWCLIKNILRTDVCTEMRVMYVCGGNIVYLSHIYIHFFTVLHLKTVLPRSFMNLQNDRKNLLKILCSERLQKVTKLCREFWERPKFVLVFCNKTCVSMYRVPFFKSVTREHNGNIAWPRSWAKPRKMHSQISELHCRHLENKPDYPKPWTVSVRFLWDTTMFLKVIY